MHVNGIYAGQGDGSTYFAAKEASETSSILMAKSKSFYNVLEANFYLEKLARMWRT
jgi:hypothetical protein